MGFFTLTGRQLSVLAALLALSFLAIVFHTLYRQPWSALWADRTNSAILEIDQVNLVPELPISHQTLDQVLSGKQVMTVPIAIHNAWKRSFYASPGPIWSDQVREVFKDRLHGVESFKGLRFAFYVDVFPESINDPTLFFHRFQGAWRLYVNGQELIDGDELLQYPAIRLPEGQQLRLTWVIENKKAHILSGPVYTHGISIRSAEEASWAQRRLPMQFQLPRLIACIGFLGLALFSAILACSGLVRATLQ